MTLTPPLLRIGLTGGIGSGKSTVAQMLAQRGAAVIDADAISRQTTAKGGAALPAIAKTFGANFITIEGTLDRERMRDRVFGDSTAKQTLESIIHPLVALETQRQTQAAIDQGARTLVFDVPLLIESGSRWRAQVDFVLLVDCAPETQIQRVMARNDLSRETVLQIMAAQAPRSQKLTAADWTIHNDGISLDELRACVHDLPLAPT